jgi:hypothetical protein
MTQSGGFAELTETPSPYFKEAQKEGFDTLHYKTSWSSRPSW